MQTIKAMNQNALEKELLTALLHELGVEEAKIQQLKQRFRCPNFAREMDEAARSAASDGLCPRLPK